CLRSALWLADALAPCIGRRSGSAPAPSALQDVTDSRSFKAATHREGCRLSVDRCVAPASHAEAAYVAVTPRSGYPLPLLHGSHVVHTRLRLAQEAGRLSGGVFDEVSPYDAARHSDYVAQVVSAVSSRQPPPA